MISFDEFAKCNASSIPQGRRCFKTDASWHGELEVVVTHKNKCFNYLVWEAAAFGVLHMCMRRV